MSKILSGKTVLVTGGTGSIGSVIVNEALVQGAKKVIVFSRDEIKHFIMMRRILDKRLETVVGDVRDPKSAEQAFRDAIDIVYHAAAMKHVVMCEEFPMEAVKTNILGTQNIVDMVLKYRVPKMVTISTDKAVDATNLMGATKYTAERLTLNGNSLSKGKQVFSCVRFGNVANSRGSVIPIYIDNLINSNPLEITNPDVTRFIMEMPDAVSLVVKATELAEGGEIFIFKMKSFKLGDLVDVMVNRIAPKLNIDPRKVRVERSNLDVGEKLHEDLINNTELSRAVSLDEMYVIKEPGKLTNHSRTQEEEKVSKYSSKDVELISHDELERIVLDYLRERDIFKYV